MGLLNTIKGWFVADADTSERLARVDAEMQVDEGKMTPEQFDRQFGDKVESKEIEPKETGIESTPPPVDETYRGWDDIERNTRLAAREAGEEDWRTAPLETLQDRGIEVPEKSEGRGV